ncbi:MAG: hypothetical protein JXA91_02605 [Candidatus Thermoplasmatota archaeon]|nr:hypothetical protein [Candidatus Thermoplasmatota archaeon]
MKNYGLVVSVCLLLITLSLSGCELLEPEPDYITVVVVVNVIVSLLDTNGNFIVDDFASGTPIQITMTKAGGQRTILNRVTDESGLFKGATGSFKVYREQPMECIVTATGTYKTYMQVAPYFEVLSWEEIDAAADFGGTYTWTVYAGVDLQDTQV